jgi:16S rRNA (uracil1498-N3)-methyltransferase
MRRLHVPIPEPAPPTVVLDEARTHYLLRVLRMGAGDPLEVFDGHGRAFAARIERVEGRTARLELGPSRTTDLGRAVTLVQALPKGDKLEWVLQKGTELGAAHFVPVTTERTTVKLPADRRDARLRRWTRIVEEAARQCGRSDVPAVESPAPLTEAVARLPPGALLILDEEERARPLGAELESLAPGAPLALVVGPEGGLTRGEVSRLAEAGARSVTLGRLVLRTETAALAALAIIRHRDGALG